MEMDLIALLRAEEETKVEVLLEKEEIIIDESENREKEVVSNPALPIQIASTPKFMLFQEVKVRPPQDTDDIEDYYYLQDFKNKKGEITEIKRKPKLTYKVDFGKGNEGYFYEGDLIQMKV